MYSSGLHLHLKLQTPTLVKEEASKTTLEMYKLPSAAMKKYDMNNENGQFTSLQPRHLFLATTLEDIVGIFFGCTISDWTL